MRLDFILINLFLILAVLIRWRNRSFRNSCFRNGSFWNSGFFLFLRIISYGSKSPNSVIIPFSWNRSTIWKSFSSTEIVTFSSDFMVMVPRRTFSPFQGRYPFRLHTASWFDLPHCTVLHEPIPSPLKIRSEFKNRLL